MRSKLTIQLSLVCLLIALFPPSALANNECKIKYGWNTGSTLQGNFKNSSKTIFLNKGQTKTINKNRLNYVKNLKTREVKFYLKDASNVTLGKNQRNPVAGTYVQKVKLKRAKCMDTATTASPASPASPEALVQALKSQNVPVKEIAKQLKNTFNKSKTDIAKLLKAGGFTAVQIAGALKEGVNASAAQIATALKAAFSTITKKSTAQILKGLNFSGSQIVAALKSSMNASITQNATAMKQAGYSDYNKMAQVAGWLKSSYNSSTEDVAVALIAAGYPAYMVAKAIVTSMGVAINPAIKILKASGLSAFQVAKAIVDAGITVTKPAVLEGLKLAGFGTKIVMEVAKTTYKMSGKVAAKSFKIAKYTAAQTAEVLKSVYKLTREQAGAALKYAGYTASQIVAALNKYYGQAKQAAKKAVRDVRRRVNTAQKGAGLATPAVAAAAKELSGWFLKAEIYKRSCKVNGNLATGGPGVFRSSYKWQGLVRKALMSGGLSSAVASNWDSAFRKAFQSWAGQVTIPGLPWYPSLAMHPKPKAPPTPNVPTPLKTLVSKNISGMAPNNLKAKIFSSLGNGANATTKDAASAFATQIGGRFANYLATAQVMNVFGTGPVKVPPAGAAGPVVNGNCFGKGMLATSAGRF